MTDYSLLLHDDISHITSSLQDFASVPVLIFQQKHSENSTTDVSRLSQAKKKKKKPLTQCAAFHQLQHIGEEKKSIYKNRWVSKERGDGTAMGAICDWSIAILGKPFFFLSHVQSVDKRHHPTDSLINCEIYSYLPPSYSHGPKTAPLPASSAFPLLDVCKERKQTGNHKDSLKERERERKKTAPPAGFPVQDCLRLPNHFLKHTALFIYMLRKRQP